jgi:DNA-binding transcriptional ArsR family regulator
MSFMNRYGDFEITDPQALRALAHPIRLAALDRLQREGPATATQLAAHVGASPSVLSWHLRHLASFGLVTAHENATDRRERWWRAVAKGYRFTLPDDAEGRAAGRQLRGEMFARYVEQPAQWLLHDEPRLDPRWQDLAGVANTTVTVTPEELARIEDAIEELLAPYVGHPDRGSDAREVRLLRFTLPTAGPGNDADAGGGA